MIVTISNKQLSATINTLGAELISLIKNNKNYIWQVDKTYWNKTSPVLFPIVGKLKNDTYTYKDISYNLPLMVLLEIWNSLLIKEVIHKLFLN